jgi:tetratricopeptide (TPR) repeat protein
LNKTKSLNITEIQILCTFAVLPENSISVPQLYEFLEIAEDEYVIFFDLLHDLSLAGWLRHLQGKYLLEQPKRFQINAELKPDSQKCSLLINFLTSKFSNLKEQNLINLDNYIIYAESVIYTLNDKSKQLATLANSLATFYDFINNINEAIKYLKKAVEIQEFVDDSTIDLAFYYNNLAILYRKIKDYKKSLNSSYKSIEANQKLKKKNDYFLINSYSTLSSTYNKVKNYPKAIEFNLKAISIGESIFEKGHIKLGGMYYDAALSFYNSIDFSTSINYIDKAVQIFKEKLPADHPTLKSSLRDQKLVHVLFKIEIFFAKHGKIIIGSILITILILLTLLIYWIFA